mmetsp:Transcript_56232/g.111766  ORF Transcript_56232/g.111766 Transcript_56232/m.111766 type:complete len:85 (+) Transcript_56232:236-490(+)
MGGRQGPEHSNCILKLASLCYQLTEACCLASDNGMSPLPPPQNSTTTGSHPHVLDNVWECALGDVKSWVKLPDESLTYGDSKQC